MDASVAGLGGCPYAKGASGNVPTEDVVFMLSKMGIETGVDLEQLVSVGEYVPRTLCDFCGRLPSAVTPLRVALLRSFMCKFLGRENASNVAKAILAKRAEAAVCPPTPAAPEKAAAAPAAKPTAPRQSPLSSVIPGIQIPFPQPAL